MGVKDGLIYVAYLNLFLCVYASQCPPNSVPGQNNDKCYYFSAALGDFLIAENTCKQFGGHLVSICSGFENLVIHDAALGGLQEYGIKEFWIGLNDLNNNGVWQWTSNSTCTYTNWADANNGDCASFQISESKWQHSDCTTPKAFACETLLDNATPTSIIASKPQCRDGYSYMPDLNACYKYVTTSMNWEDAEKNCQQEGGHLASIHSLDAEAFIDNLMPKNVGSWIGYFLAYGSDLTTPANWGWTDVTDGFYYRDWHPGNPSNGYSCAYMQSSGNPYNTDGRRYWANDGSCATQKRTSICKQFPICQ